MIYKFRSGFSCPVPAKVVGQRLEELRAANDESLTPDVVVEDARPHDAPLHECFTWDDSLAASEFRKGEARRLISSVRVVVLNQETRQARHRIAYVSVRTPEQGRRYMTTARIADDEVLKERMLSEALTQLEAWQRRYRELAELAGVVELVGEAISQARQAV